VSGSDSHASDRTEALTAAGVAVTIGHTDLQGATQADLVVSTRAVLLADTVEVRAATAAGVPVVKRGEVLAMLANARTCVAVAGSHGKSTTSGMLVTALEALGHEPSYAVGAVVGATGTNAALGRGEAMVVEADEFDYAFLWLSPDVAIVTNIEFDHPDIFFDQASYDAAFVQFAERVGLNGTLILADDDPGCQRLRASISDSFVGNLVTFGETSTADWRLTAHDANWSVQVPGGGIVPLALQVPGRHNARNALAAIAALDSLGVRADEAVGALESFAGVGRRFETKGEAAGVLVIDDYAHHPSEIRATLRAARDQYPGRNLWAVFQPHTFSRTKALLNDFAASFEEADDVMILDIYPARETDSLGISSEDLLELIPIECAAGGRPIQAVERLAHRVSDGDVVITLGAGDVTCVGPALLERLRSRVSV
jgi:UDP-N-acetylmuramate--alanine ligase